MNSCLQDLCVRESSQTVSISASVSSRARVYTSMLSSTYISWRSTCFNVTVLHGDCQWSLSLHLMLSFRLVEACLQREVLLRDCEANMLHLHEYNMRYFFYMLCFSMQ